MSLPLQTDFQEVIDHFFIYYETSEISDFNENSGEKNPYSNLLFLIYNLA